MRDLSFRELTADDDLREYHDLARDRMNGIDMVTETEMSSLLTHRLGRLWIALDSGRRVGYCSILIQSPDRPDRSVHFLNMFVLEGLEGRGYGTAMVGYRVEKFGHLPLVVAIRPDNGAMQTIAKRFGFRPGFERGHWTVWHRPIGGVLINAPRLDSAVANQLAAGTRARGSQVEVCVEGETYRDPVTLARWPDPAAFQVHARSRE